MPVRVETTTAKGIAGIPISVSVGTTATLLFAANTARKVAYIVNNSAQVVYVGGNVAVSTSGGIPLAANAILVDADSISAWYAIVVSGTADVRVMEVA